MTTKFDVGDEVFITGVIKEINVDKDGICYEVRHKYYYGSRQDTFSEDSLMLRKKFFAGKDNEEKTN